MQQEQFRYAIRNRYDALSCLRYNLKLAKRDMDADPPPFGMPLPQHGMPD